MVVFDVILNGEVKETIIPSSQRLKDICSIVKDQFDILKEKYGSSIEVTRRLIY
ncbi:mechanosensitive ion channel protein MscL [Paenibacillus sp. MBLB4367]|uniref:mechanosensitive ion channel protein MscL n=1 Tax=Paenibacillus sp. MBLB4367 TaxID=3384767 RepID=UPI003907F4B2